VPGSRSSRMSTRVLPLGFLPNKQIYSLRINLYSHTHTHNHTLNDKHVSCKLIICEGSENATNRQKFTRTRCMARQYISEIKMRRTPQNLNLQLPCGASRFGRLRLFVCLFACCYKTRIVNPLGLYPPAPLRCPRRSC